LMDGARVEFSMKPVPNESREIRQEDVPYSLSLDPELENQPAGQ